MLIGGTLCYPGWAVGEEGSACVPVTQEDVQSGHELPKEGCDGKPAGAA